MNIYKLLIVLVFILSACRPNEGAEPTAAEPMVCDTLSGWKTADDSLFVEVATPQIPPQFVLVSDVCPDIIEEIRYYSTFNFVGQRVPGYERPVAYLTREAAESVKAVSDELKSLGYRLKIFDAYRPQKAVDFFIRWGHDLKDERMKGQFYPDCPKSELFRRGYLAHKSGHTRGSTVDVTLFDVNKQCDVDMGSTYDLLGEPSHFGYTKGLSREQIANRRLLREVMSRHGFKPISCEWWHFTLRNEPYPNTYFKFPIR